MELCAAHAVNDLGVAPRRRGKTAKAASAEAAQKLTRNNGQSKKIIILTTNFFRMLEKNFAFEHNGCKLRLFEQ